MTESTTRNTEAAAYAKQFYADNQVTAAGVRAWALENVEGFTATRGQLGRDILDSYAAAFPRR